MGLTPGNAANQRRHARETDRIVHSNGIFGLSNYPGLDLAHYREHIGRLGGLAIQQLTTEQFVPYSIGQLGISFVPADRSR